MSMTRHRLLDNTYKKTAEGEQISVKSVARMYHALTLYGKSTQDGTPNPESPVPIESVGEDGEINITISEKGINLFKNTGENKDYSTSDKNWAYGSQNNAIVTITGNQAHFTASETGTNLNTGFQTNYKNNSLVINFRCGEKYVWSCDAKGHSQSAVMQIFYTNVVGSSWVSTGRKEVQLTEKWERYSCEFTIPNDFDEEANRIILNFAIGTDTTAYLDIKKLKLERGSIATGWSPSPYDGEPLNMQTLTASTPNGLPGIPVDSGGNYTDADGQQWVCDEIDFVRGVYVQRVNKKILTSALPWKFALTTGNGNNNFQIRLTSEEGATGVSSGKPVNSMCNFLKYAGLAWDDNEINLPKIYASSLEITASFPPDSEVNSLQKWNELLDGIGNCYIYYILYNPIETPLSAEQISAYKALHTNYPTTTVMNDSDAGMKLTYKTRKSLEVT